MKVQYRDTAGQVWHVIRLPKLPAHTHYLTVIRELDLLGNQSDDPTLSPIVDTHIITPHFTVVLGRIGSSGTSPASDEAALPGQPHGSFHFIATWANS